MPLETLTQCPVCSQSESKQFLSVEDHTVSHEKFTIQECSQCGFLYTNPRPDETSIGRYYESDEYISHHDETPTLISRVYKTVRDYTIGRKLKLLNTLSPKKGKVLDIGCGTGVFIDACQEQGWVVNATEPDAEARKIASERIKKNIRPSIFDPAFEYETFDIITMWHVLEHVHRLDETVEWISSHLNREGTAVIAVPNHESDDAVKYGPFWAAYDVPRHLYHFNKKTMSHLLKKHGLRVDLIKPMWFDSFYVSMLSTKYRYGSTNIPESVFTGFVSNWKGRRAKNTDYNTSSLIYIVKKN